jgi:phosphoglycerate dehydrogenase-like enzyme
MRHGGAEQLSFANAGPIWAPACAEHAMALLLAVTRGLPTLLARMWQKQPCCLFAALRLGQKSMPSRAVPQIW